MLIASWILTILAYAGGAASLVIGIINPGILGETITLFDCIIMFIIVFVGLGFIGHMLATSAVTEERSGAGLAVWIISFLPYITPTIALLIVIQILRIIDWVVYMLTDKHTVAQFVNTVTESLFNKQLRVFAGAGNLNDDSGTVQTEVITIQSGGFERQLVMVDQYVHDMWNRGYDVENPYYNQHYRRYRDDLGNYWRSYDGGNNFISEAEMDRKGWKN